MLDFLRRGVKSWVAKVLLALLILSFAVWGLEGIFSGRAASTVATVGETRVETDRLTRALYRQQQQLSQRAGQLVSFADLRAAGVDQQILAGLVREATYTEELETLGISVPDDFVAEFIAINPAFRDAQDQFNPIAYQSVLAQQGLSPQQYEQTVRRSLGRDILTDALSQGVAPPPGFAAAIARYDSERRRVAVIRLPASNAPDPNTPEVGALEAYLEANAEDFRTPERRSGQFIWISQEAMAAEMEPTEEEIADAFNQNPDAYAVEAVRVVEQIVFETQAAADAAATRLTAGEIGFAELAAEMNLTLDDIQLGDVREGELAPAASDAIFATNEPGLVGPVDGPFGPILLNVTDVTLGGTPTLDAVADAIRMRLAADAARRKAIDALQQIDERRASGEGLDTIAEATGLELVSFSGLARNGSVTEGQTPFLIVDPRFWPEISSATVGEEREITELSDGSYLLALVSRIEETRIPELDEVEEDVLNAWAADQRITALEARALELTGGAGGGTDLASISVATLQGISERAAFPRGEAPEDFSAELVEAIFETADGGIAVGRNAVGDAVLIVQVRGVIAVPEEALAEQVEEIEAALAGSIARDQLELYARALEERHGSGVNIGAVDSVFDQLGGAHSRGGM